MAPRNTANESKESPGMAAARRALGARKGPPTDADRPAPSTFGMTAAAREALRLNKEKGR